MTITFQVSEGLKPEKVTISKEFKYKLLYNGNDSIPEKKIIKTTISETNSKHIGCNSFIYSAFYAYSNHHNLHIRPDDIWFAILTQFSLYVNANSEQLRDKIVDFQGKKELVVYGGGTLMTAAYEQLTNDMTIQIEKNIKDPSIREWITGKFTTTTPNDTMAASIALMSSLQNFFEYKMSLRCGLPEVTLHGTIDDWIDIKNRVEKLLEFDFNGNNNQMKKWVELLLPVIENLIQTAKGEPDLYWWNQIANQQGGGSGPRYLSGWCTVFACFDNDGKWIGDNQKVPNQWSELTTDWLFVNTNAIPKGFVSVPVLIDDNGIEYKTEFYAGHISVSHPTPETIQPNIEWCILLK